MIIRATKKVLDLARIKPIKLENSDISNFPGEWFVDLISLGKPGKFALQFLHAPTYVSIIIPGKSLNTTLNQLESRTEQFLTRNGFKELIAFFSFDSDYGIYSNSNKSLQAHLNQIKYTASYNCQQSKSVEEINFQQIENLFLDYPFTTKKTGSKYLDSRQILESYLKDL